MRQTSLKCIVRLLLITLATGCGGDGKISVTGSVSWNGEPIEKGHVIFTPVDPTIGPDASTIENGTFAFRSATGEKRVEIFADRPVGEPDPVMQLQRFEQFIPTRYNELTELTATVASGADNQFQFDLKSRDGDTMAGSDVARSPGK